MLLFLTQTVCLQMILIVSVDNMSQEKWLLMLLLTAVIVIFIFKTVTKKQVFKGRKTLRLEQIFEDEVAKYGIRYGVFENIFLAIGECYDVDPMLLRPTDSLKILYDIDSWELEEGTEQFNNFLERKFGIAYLDNKPVTLLELMISIEEKLL